ncbi:MAG: type I-C CRISPR-associated protein Cas7/Csd2 [Candidatus Brocadiia bacterium]
MNAIENRYDFALLFDVTDGNPNGDPDAGNSPRMDPETGHGLVTDVCLKRKVRNFVCLRKPDENGVPPAGYDIYVKEKAVLNQQHEKAYKALNLSDSKDDKDGKVDKVALAREWMCKTFFDIRMFGAVMSTGDKKCGQVRGPVQFAFARSVDPIAPTEHSITRMAITTEEEAKKQQGDNRTMGRKQTVPYGLYVAHGFISPSLAAQTKFSEADLQLLWEALQNMFEHDHSAARGMMSTRKLIVFKHDSVLGNAPAHRLFDRVSIKRKDSTRPARSFSDYEVKIDGEGLPQGVQLIEM